MKGKFIIFLCMMTFSAMGKSYQIKEIKFDTINYRIFYYNKFSFKDINRFHNIFKKQYAMLYDRFNVKRPVFIKINLTFSSKIFRHLTGLKWYVAGLYYSERDMFYFQNPSSLIKRGIVLNIIRHEITHQVIHHAKKKDIKTKYFISLEESFCQALFPVNLQNIKIKFSKMKHFKTYHKFSEYLNNNLKSRKFSVRKKGYKTAELWGNYLLKNIGEQKFFKMLTENNNTTLLNKLYKSFYIKYLSAY